MGVVTSLFAKFRGSRSVLRVAIGCVALIAGLSLGAASGCEGGKEDFLSCKLDPILTDPTFANRPCTSDIEGRGSQETCVVDPHPQCPTNICLAWSGANPFCTETCATNADCPEASVCLGYGVGEADPSISKARYCVKITALQCDSDADCFGGTCPPVVAGPRRCLAPQL